MLAWNYAARVLLFPDRATFAFLADFAATNPASVDTAAAAYSPAGEVLPLRVNEILTAGWGYCCGHSETREKRNRVIFWSIRRHGHWFQNSAPDWQAKPRSSRSDRVSGPHTMSRIGSNASFCPLPTTSGPPQSTDIARPARFVRFVPLPDSMHRVSLPAPAAMPRLLLSWPLPLRRICRCLTRQGCLIRRRRGEVLKQNDHQPHAKRP